MENKEEYKGWTNWETWDTYNWLTSDEGAYRHCIEVIQECQAEQWDTEEDIKNYFEDLIEEGYVKDRISVRKINWREVIEVIKESI